MKLKTNARRNALDGPFTAIARAQSRSWKVNIVASGSVLATDGNTIYFPWNSDDIDTIPFNVLNGYLDHEVGHIAEEREHAIDGRETPLEIAKRQTNITKRMLLNVYEDIRMEIKRGKIYPGVAANLKASNEHSVGTFIKRFGDGDGMEKANFWHTLGCGIIFAARELDTFWLPEQYAPFMEMLQPEIEESRHVVWAQDSMELVERTFEKVRELAKDIEDWMEKKTALKKEEKGESESSDTKGKSESDTKDEGGVGGPSEDGSDDATAEDGDGASDSAEGGDQEVGEGEESASGVEGGVRRGDNAEGDTSFGSPSTSAEDTKEDMSEGKEEVPCDGAEKAAEITAGAFQDADTDDIMCEGKKEIEKASEDLSTLRGGYNPCPSALEADQWIVPKKGEEAIYNQIKKQVQQQISALRSKLIHIIRSRAISREQYEQDNGKLDTSSLYRLRLGSKQVFSKTVSGQMLDTAVTVLVDLSGSMGDSNFAYSRACYARMTAVALAETFESINVPFEIIGFHNSYDIPFKPDRSGAFVNRLPFEYHVYKSFEEVHRSVRCRLVGITGRQENADGEAIVGVARRLVVRPESRKLMFVISDGKPVCPGLSDEVGSRHLIDSIKKVRGAGIILFGIGVQHLDIVRYYGVEHSICVDKLDKMAENIFKVVRSVLIAGLKKVA